MPIRPRGDAWQVDVAYKGNRKQRQAPTEIEAAKLEVSLLAELKTECDAPSGARLGKAWTVGQAVERTIERVWKGTKAERTSVLNARLIEAWFTKSRPLDTIDQNLIDDFKKHLQDEQGNSNSTINRKLACLSKILSIAVDRKGLDPLLKPKLEMEKEYHGRIRFLTDEEEGQLTKLFTQWEKPDHLDALRVLIDVGMREGELFRIEKRDFNPETRMVSLWQRKGNLPSSIPLTVRAFDIFQRRCEGLVSTAKVFPYNVWWMRNQWDRARSHMGLAMDKEFVPHALRHTCASRLVQRSVSIKVVRDILGHKTIQVTMRYAHLAPGNLSAAMAVLEPQAKANA